MFLFVKNEQMGFSPIKKMLRGMSVPYIYPLWDLNNFVKMQQGFLKQNQRTNTCCRACTLMVQKLCLSLIHACWISVTYLVLLVYLNNFLYCSFTAIGYIH